MSVNYVLLVPKYILMVASHSSPVLPFKCAVGLELFMDRAYEKDENKVGYISAADLLNTIESSGYKISSRTTIRSPNKIFKI